jgi:hypothetical protein
VAFAASLAPALALFIATIVAISTIPFALFAMPVAIIILYSTMLLGGVPIFLLFRMLGWANWWTATLSGAILGFASIHIAMDISGPGLVASFATPFTDMKLLFSGIATGIGAMTGAIFYMIARLRA